jgi:hypothetical protein
MFFTLRLSLWQSCLLFFCLVLGTCVFSSSAWAVSTKAGMVIFVNQNATAESAGKTRSLALRSPIFVGDVIKTDATGSVQILFDDDSILALAEDGKVTINRFVYSGTGIAASQNASADGGTGVENKSSASGASGSDGGASGGSSASASSGGYNTSSGSGDSSASASGNGSGTSGAGGFTTSERTTANTSGGIEGSSVSASGNGTGSFGSTGDSSASAVGGGIGVSGGATVTDGGASGGMPGGVPSGTGVATGGTSGGMGGIPSASSSGDGLSLTVSEGTAAFGSGGACRNGCDVVTLAGMAGIGGKDEKAMALNDRSTGSGVLLTVTASAQTKSSTISAVAVAPNMQVAISGVGMATQALARNSMARLGSGMATVSALDTGNLQSQMGKMALGSATFSNQLAATTRSVGVADLAAKGAGSLGNISRNGALGGSLATPQAKAVGVANTSTNMNIDMTAALGLTGGESARLTRQTVSSTVDFSGNKLLSYNSSSTVQIADSAGVSQGQLQVDIALKGATSLSANAMESALATGGALSKVVDLNGGTLGSVADTMKKGIDAGGSMAKPILDSGIAGKRRAR